MQVEISAIREIPQVHVRLAPLHRSSPAHIQAAAARVDELADLLDETTSLLTTAAQDFLKTTNPISARLYLRGHSLAERLMLAISRATAELASMKLEGAQ